MGIYRQPPPVTQSAGRVASTPPVPHVPIPTKGSEPPPIPALSVTELMKLIRAWPLPLEPRLHWRDFTLIKRIPITKGDEPPIQAPLSVNELTKFVRAWPRDLEPRLPWRDAVLIKFPLPTKGDEPPILAPLSTTELTKFTRAWIPPAYRLPTLPPTAAWNVTVVVSGDQPYLAFPYPILASWTVDAPRRVGRTLIAPLTLDYGDEPPLRGPLSEQARVLAWPTDLEPRLVWPNNTRISIAPLTFTYGDAPPTVPLWVLPLLIGTWVPLPPQAPVRAITYPWETVIPPPPTGVLKLILVDGELAIWVNGIYYTKV